MQYLPGPRTDLAGMLPEPVIVELAPSEGDAFMDAGASTALGSPAAACE